MPNNMCCCLGEGGVEPPVGDYAFLINLKVNFKSEVYETGLVCEEYQRYSYHARRYIIESQECGNMTLDCDLPLEVKVISLIPIPETGFCTIVAEGTFHLVDPTECAGNCDPLIPPRIYLDDTQQVCLCLDFGINCDDHNFDESTQALCTGSNICAVEVINCWNFGLPLACFAGTVKIRITCSGPNPDTFENVHNGRILIPGFFADGAIVNCEWSKAEWRVDGRQVKGTGTGEFEEACDHAAHDVLIAQSYVHPDDEGNIELVAPPPGNLGPWISSPAYRLYNSFRIDPGCPRDQFCDLSPPFVNCDCYPPGGAGSYDPNAIANICVQICATNDPNCHPPNNFSDELIEKIEFEFIG